MEGDMGGALQCTTVGAGGQPGQGLGRLGLGVSREGLCFGSGRS